VQGVLELARERNAGNVYMIEIAGSYPRLPRYWDDVVWNVNTYADAARALSTERRFRAAHLIPVPAGRSVSTDPAMQRSRPGRVPVAHPRDGVPKTSPETAPVVSPALQPPSPVTTRQPAIPIDLPAGLPCGQSRRPRDQAGESAAAAKLLRVGKVRRGVGQR
jgi:hypothetical protein